MKDCSLITWDVASMSHKASVGPLDISKRDLRNSNCTMGGCAVLSFGGYRQNLAVITRGTRADEINESL
jgi:PIF1 helicase.